MDYSVNPQDDDDVTFTLTTESKVPGVAYVLSNETNPNSITAYGTTAVAFSTDGTEGNIAIGNITNFTQLSNTAGTDATLGAWYISASRNGESDQGVAYNVVVSYGTNEGVDSAESKFVLCKYITSSVPGDLYRGYDNPFNPIVQQDYNIFASQYSSINEKY